VNGVSLDELVRAAKRNREVRRVNPDSASAPHPEPPAAPAGKRRQSNRTATEVPAQTAPAEEAPPVEKPKREPKAEETPSYEMSCSRRQAQ